MVREARRKVAGDRGAVGGQRPWHGDGLFCGPGDQDRLGGAGDRSGEPGREQDGAVVGVDDHSVGRAVGDSELGVPAQSQSVPDLEPDQCHGHRVWEGRGVERGHPVDPVRATGADDGSEARQVEARVDHRLTELVDRAFSRVAGGGAVLCGDDKRLLGRDRRAHRHVSGDRDRAPGHLGDPAVRLEAHRLGRVVDRDPLVELTEVDCHRPRRGGLVVGVGNVLRGLVRRQAQRRADPLQVLEGARYKVTRECRRALGRDH